MDVQRFEMNAYRRKTDSILFGACFGLPALPVDTRVGRVSFRIGWTASKDPVRIEGDLAGAIPPVLY